MLINGTDFLIIFQCESSTDKVVNVLLLSLVKNFEYAFLKYWKINMTQFIVTAYKFLLHYFSIVWIYYVRFIWWILFCIKISFIASLRKYSCRPTILFLADKTSRNWKKNRRYILSHSEKKYKVHYFIGKKMKFLAHDETNIRYLKIFDFNWSHIIFIIGYTRILLT